MLLWKNLTTYDFIVMEQKRVRGKQAAIRLKQQQRKMESRNVTQQQQFQATDRNMNIEETLHECEEVGREIEIVDQSSSENVGIENIEKV